MNDREQALDTIFETFRPQVISYAQGLYREWLDRPDLSSFLFDDFLCDCGKAIDDYYYNDIDTAWGEMGRTDDLDIWAMIAEILDDLCGPKRMRLANYSLWLNDGF